ncbi:cell envelope integrity protein TolA [Candidatus Halobeggiatoa sp. HSG11]|nr:cell envelope integrity protein TolA [Candidatus Halobeggiatoa sp. HSG11]
MKVFNKPAPPPLLEEIMPAAIVNESLIVKKNLDHQNIFQQQQNLQVKTQRIEKKIISAEKLLTKTEKRKQQEQDILNKILEQKAIEAKKLAKEREEAKKLIARLEAEKKLIEERKQAEELARLELENLQPEQQSEEVQEAQEEQGTSKNIEQIKEIIELLQNKLDQHWVRPRGFYGGLSCLIKISIQMGGIVEDVEIVTRSGNIAFDHSAITAVKDASPLPIPDELFMEFKEFNFNFKK